MTLVRFPRCAPTLLQLEDRCTPAGLITVYDSGWNPATKGTLPWAIAEANSAAYPGQDVIQFDFSPVAAGGLGPKPTINSTGTENITEGVIIQGANGNDYVTITGTRPFDFTHMLPAPVEPGGTPATESVIDRVTFHDCKAPGLNGGAVRVTGGTVVTRTARFLENSAQNGGAVFVGHNGTLVVDGVVAGPTDYHPLQNQPRTLFKQNDATFDGGAIENEGTVVLQRGWFIGNEANRGGAISVYQQGVLLAPMLAGGEGPMTPDVQINGNTGRNHGGGVYFNSDSNSVLNGVVFWENTGTVTGGAMSVVLGTVDLVGGFVVGNTAGAGQGVHIKGDPMVIVPTTVNATAVWFQGNVDLAGKAGVPVLIDDNGELNTAGCAFNGWGLPSIVPGSSGVWNADPFNPDTP